MIHFWRKNGISYIINFKFLLTIQLWSVDWFDYWKFDPLEFFKSWLLVGFLLHKLVDKKCKKMYLQIVRSWWQGLPLSPKNLPQQYKKYKNSTVSSKTVQTLPPINYSWGLYFNYVITNQGGRGYPKRLTIDDIGGQGFNQRMM